MPLASPVFCLAPIRSAFPPSISLLSRLPSAAPQITLQLVHIQLADAAEQGIFPDHIADLHRTVLVILIVRKGYSQIVIPI